MSWYLIHKLHHICSTLSSFINHQKFQRNFGEIFFNSCITSLFTVTYSMEFGFSYESYDLNYTKQGK